jgi:uncharacterized protein
MKQCISLFFLLFFTACQPAAVSATQTLPAPHVVVETVTPSSIPTETFTPSPTPTTEEAIFPYTIDGLRQHVYQSGEIHIRSMLDENDKFTTYLIDYPSDGLTITGMMLMPKGDGPFPVILMNHGFFSRSVFSSGDGTDRSAAFLADYGYITLASDYRSWGASDVAESLFYSGLVIDVINLLRAIPSIPQADPTRVGIWGHSMGGGTTIKVLTVVGDNVEAESSRPMSAIQPTIKAAVLYSPVSADFADIIDRWGNGCFGDILEGEQIIGCNSADVVPLDLPLSLQEAYRFTAQNGDMLKEVSPIYHLENVAVPVQIHYGSEDGKTLAGTPPEWSVKLTQALRDEGKYAEMYQYEGQGHSFIGQPWFDFMIRVLRFFDEHVKNG